MANEEQVEHTETEQVEATSTETPNEGQAREGNPDFDAEVSRAVAKALANNDKKWQAKIDAAKKEATSYAKMTKEQQKEADLKAREQALVDKEQALNRKQLLTDVTADLGAKGLPTAFAEVLVKLDDNDAIAQAVADIKAAWDESVAAQLKASARQSTPKTGRSGLDADQPIDLAKMAADARIIKN